MSEYDRLCLDESKLYKPVSPYVGGYLLCWLNICGWHT